MKSTWVGTRRGPLGRNCQWESPLFPGVIIRHCGHLTALRPYYLNCAGEKFRRLDHAIEFAEGIENGKPSEPQ